MSRRRPLRAVIERYFAPLRKSQRTTLCALSRGLMASGRVGLAAIARGMRDQTTVRHRIKRAARFAQNERISTEVASACLAQWLSASVRRAIVALDWTRLKDHDMLAAMVIVDRRAVPLAWRVVKEGLFSRRTKSRNDLEEQLIAHVARILAGIDWVLVADRGFGRASLVRWLNERGISYVLRATGTTWVKAKGVDCRLDNVPRSPGMLKRYRQALYQKQMRVPTTLVVAHLDRSAPEPWYLVTNLPAQSRRIVKTYERRMGIEEAFRDMKWNLLLGELWLALPERIERLLLVVAVVMLAAALSGLDHLKSLRGRDPQLSTHKPGGTLSFIRIGLALLMRDGPPANLRRLRFATEPATL